MDGVAEKETLKEEEGVTEVEEVGVIEKVEVAEGVTGEAVLVKLEEAEEDGVREKTVGKGDGELLKDGDGELEGFTEAVGDSEADGVEV